ncbi:aldehyde dehydrogenase [Gangjinia marincola]|uniref:Aldehyde dehydrogenase n=1 Tax=Gangjinia marincola TaxID=578463 RepID=A0ABP3XR84_9FLAO
MPDFTSLLQKQRTYFKDKHTIPVEFRLEILKKLREVLVAREKDITAALYADFKKPEFEGVITETAYTLNELDLTIKKLTQWARPKKVSSAFINFPSTDYLYSEPYGVTLIISPWNYPYQLAMGPLIGAIAAGNTVVLKPSEYSAATSQLLEELITEVFDPAHAKVVQGGVEESKALLDLEWDYIFFTGSVNVGRIVAKAAAPHLTPCTLELGGKNPCIIDASAKIELAAKRITWGKFLNAGQTCIAPDYILVEQSVKEKFIAAMKKEIEEAYGNTPEASNDYARMISAKHFERMQELIEGETVLFGGQSNANDHYIAPTLLDEPKRDSAVMEDEIFGPILPILSYSTTEDLDELINSYGKPLSLYVFSEDAAFAEEMITRYSFGGGTVNDTIVHFTNKKLPFGGVGNSGYGAYHGKRTFDTFSHKKAITKRGTWLDIPVRYAPYSAKKLKLIRKSLKWF